MADDLTSDPLDAVRRRYAVAVTEDMRALIDPGDPADPIAAQFLPDVRELTVLPEERADPIDDAGHSPVEGIVHRYPDRILLKALHVCPVYCRFCFRREMVGPDGDGALTGAKLDAALAYIARHPAIWEVILTGGDPFMLSPRRAGEIARALAAVEHVKVVRWHTRVPVVDPARVTDAFVEAITPPGAAVWVAIHANHAREFTPAADAALSRLARAGVSLVSQSVLLRGVNDSVAALEDLMRAFVMRGVKPDYLHHPDLAPGTAQFRLGIAEGRALMRALHKRASGLCLPTYVLDAPDGAIKAPLGPDYVTGDDAGGWRVRTHDRGEVGYGGATFRLATEV